MQKSKYKFNEAKWTFTIRSDVRGKQRTVDVIFMDDLSRELILNNCVNIQPTTAFEQLLSGLSCGYDERKAVVRVVMPNKGTFVALFEKPLQIWKFFTFLHITL